MALSALKEGSSASGSTAHLEMLGALRVSLRSSAVKVKSRKSRALLAYLALTPQHTDSRIRIAGLLWSEKSDYESRVSLRQELMGLRREFGAVGVNLVQSDRLNTWLDADAIVSDINEVVAALDSGIVPEVLLERKGLTDDFLRDLNEIDPAFDYWLAVQRESYRDLLLRKLVGLLDIPAAGQQQYRAALALHNLDPTNEEACRALMQYHAARGDVAAALRIYNELWSLLDRDFDMEPTDETQSLVARIKLHDASITPIRPAREASASGSVPRHGHIVVTVAAFLDEGLESKHARRVAGLRHELVAALTRFRDWSVRDAGAEISPDLLAGRRAYEISASALEEDGELYVSLVLKRHSDGTYLWGQRVSIQLDKWLSAKLHVIRRIAAAMEVQISAERLARTSSLPDQNLDIYDRWLRANELVYNWQPNDEIRAEAIFRSILVDTQDFAPAHVGLVQILNTRHHIFPGVLRSRERELEALNLAKAAVKIDPRDCRTQLCLAWSHILNGNFEQAIFCYDLALQLNENDPWTLTSCAQGLSYCDQKLRARQLADRALDVAVGGVPMHWSYQLCIRFLEGDYAGALSAAENADDAAFFVPAWRAATMAHLRQYAAAHREVDRFYALIAQNWYGPEPVSRVRVLDWLCTAFPIRLEADRKRLRAGVVAAGLLETA